MSPMAIIVLALLFAGLAYIVGLVIGIHEGMRIERERIRDRIITDQATGSGDYAEAEEYAERMVKP